MGKREDSNKTGFVRARVLGTYGAVEPPGPTVKGQGAMQIVLLPHTQGRAIERFVCRQIA